MPGVQLNVPTMATLGTDIDVSGSCTSSLQTVHTVKFRK